MGKAKPTYELDLIVCDIICQDGKRPTIFIKTDTNSRHVKFLKGENDEKSIRTIDKSA
jgi:hypothetical protein